MQITDYILDLQSLDMTHLKKIYLGIICLFFPFLAQSQISSFGFPQYGFDEADAPESALKLLHFPKYAEDKEAQNPLYSVPTEVNWTLENAGIWKELPNGDAVWHLKIIQNEATGTGLFYKNFYLPEGAKLYYFNEDRTEIKGAYTAKNNSASGRFFTGFIKGGVSYIEYYEPAAVRGQGHFTIFRVDQMLVAEEEKSAVLNFGFGTSDACHVNINCTEGDDFQTEKKGICRIMMTLEEGTAWCSGTLLNNARNDETPYVLSAFHCTDGYTPLYDLWRFDFNYESSDCNNPSTEPTYQSILGCEFRAGRQETDFQLLEIDGTIPTSFNVYYNGWDRTDFAAAKMHMLHHPSADIMKYSEDIHALTIHPNPINWSNSVSTPANRHFKSTMDIGTFQVGSSGAPFFDINKRVVAQLHGGNLGCNNPVVFGGRLHYSWDDGTGDAEQLEPWLDPDGTGIDFIDGLEPDQTSGSAIVSGQVVNQNGVGVGGVTVRVNGDESSAVTTEANGVYQFELPVGSQYQLSFEKNFNHGNGVFTSDIIKMRRVILNLETYDNPYSFLAGDVNGSNSVATSDIITIRQFILNLINIFPNNVPSWRFVPQAYVFPDENNPWSDTIPNGIFINDLQSDILNINIVGIKMGDVNVSANPEN